jgi:hypothetical protein
MKNKTKLKVVTMVLAGGLAVAGGIQYNKHLGEISQMSETQLQDAIKECDTALERLQRIIDADKTNPEERFEARRAYKSISEQREQFQNRLDKLQKNQTTTINFHDASKLR